MELTDIQKQTVAEWVAKGASLAEVQRQMQETLGIKATYMDVRFLVLELGVAVKEKPAPRPPAPPPTPAPAGAGGFDPGAEADLGADDGPDLGASPPGASTVRVDLDRIMKPGSLVSGTVVFSDGVSAAWALDQFGRLALNPAQPGYQPGPQDVQAFQMELRRALEKRGF